MCPLFLLLTFFKYGAMINLERILNLSLLRTKIQIL